MRRPMRYWVLQHLVNPLNRALIGAGRMPAEMVVLELRGRRSGRTRRAPIALIEREGARWLVDIYGRSRWVRNARAAGQADLYRAGRREHVRLEEVPAREHPEVVEEVWHLAPAVSKFFASPFIAAREGDSTEAWRAEAARHEIFRVVAGQGTVGR